MYIFFPIRSNICKECGTSHYSQTMFMWSIVVMTQEYLNDPSTFYDWLKQRERSRNLFHSIQVTGNSATSGVVTLQIVWRASFLSSVHFSLYNYRICKRHCIIWSIPVLYFRLTVLYLKYRTATEIEQWHWYPFCNANLWYLPCTCVCKYGGVLKKNY